MMTAEFVPTREAGLARLQDFAPRAGSDYARLRNYDFGPDKRGNISCLSPFVRHRLILETEILQAILQRYSPGTAEKFVQEVFWRGYFKGWLEHYPGVWDAYEDERDAAFKHLSQAPALKRSYEKAINAITGIDAFDAFAHELSTTGYLHNHARMWFASIWIFTLRLPWVLGADFFLRMLIDGDPASNTLSWRWVGGLHTRGKTYLARRDNISKFTDGRFSPAGLAGSAVALDEETAFATADPFSRVSASGACRRPDGAHDKPIYLITEDDGHAESLFATLKPPPAPVAIAGIGAPDLRSPLAPARHVTDFVDTSIADSLARAGAHFNAPTRQFSGVDSDALAAWAHGLGATHVIAPFAPAGPTRKLADNVSRALGAYGIGFSEQMRPYDRLVWPHANKGFFKLKKKIPDLIAQLDISGEQLSLI